MLGYPDKGWCSDTAAASVALYCSRHSDFLLSMDSTVNFAVFIYYSNELERADIWGARAHLINFARIFVGRNTAGFRKLCYLGLSHRL